MTMEMQFTAGVAADVTDCYTHRFQTPRREDNGGASCIWGALNFIEFDIHRLLTVYKTAMHIQGHCPRDIFVHTLP